MQNPTYLVKPAYDPLPQTTIEEMSILVSNQSKNHRLGIIHTKEQAHRILVVDKPTERRTDAVAQQALSLGTQMLGFRRWDLFVVNIKRR